MLKNYITISFVFLAILYGFQVQAGEAEEPRFVDLSMQFVGIRYTIILNLPDMYFKPNDRVLLNGTFLGQLVMGQIPTLPNAFVETFNRFQISLPAGTMLTDGTVLPHAMVIYDTDDVTQGQNVTVQTQNTNVVRINVRSDQANF